MRLPKHLTFGLYFLFNASQGCLHPRMNLLSVALTMTMRDHFHPPFSDCVRVTTRGQKPELILYCTLSEAAGERGRDGA